MSEPSTYPEFHSAELFRTDRVGRTWQVLYCPGTPLPHIKELRMHDCITYIDIKVYQGYLKESNINCMVTMCIDFQALFGRKKVGLQVPSMTLLLPDSEPMQLEKKVFFLEEHDTKATLPNL